MIKTTGARMSVRFFKLHCAPITAVCAQGDIIPRGSSLQCRMYAEDPFNNFMPSPGDITEHRAPVCRGVRSDSGVQAGSCVSIHYDSMIAKLIAWGRGRPQVIRRMQQALEQYRIAGVRTSIHCYMKLLGTHAFLSGEYTTTFVERKSTPVVHVMG